MPSATPIPASTPIQYQAPICGRVYPRGLPALRRHHPAVRVLPPSPAAALPARDLLWTRLLIWGATILAYLVFEAQYAQPLHTGGAEDVVKHDVGWAIDVWARWDSGWFLGIAQHGYTDRATPRRSSRCTRCSCAVSGGSSSATTCWRVFSSRRPRRSPPSCSCGGWPASSPPSEVANRSVLYLALFPTTLFLVAVYSESLYLALSVAAFLLARRARWGWAGLTIGLATLARVSGVVLLPALAMLAWRAPNRAPRSFGSRCPCR